MPRWRKMLILFLSAAVVGWLAYGTVNYLTPPDEEEAQGRLNQVAAADFHFTSVCLLSVDGEARRYFEISGAKSDEDMYFSGIVLGTPVSLYLVDGVAYQQSGDAPWRVNEIPDIQQALTLFAELDPSAAFSFSDLEDFQYLGVEKVEGSAYFHLLFRPLQEGWVGEYFDDVRYTVWLPRGRQDHFLVEVTGAMKSDPDTSLDMTIRFYDIGGDIHISPPAM